MALIAVSSVKGSPGATTLATGLAFAWPGDARPPLLVEADPDGGVLAARLGLRLHQSLADAATHGRHGLSERAVLDHAQRIEGSDVHVLLGPAAGEEAAAVLSKASEPLAVHLAAQHAFDVVADVGRVTTRSPSFALARHAALTILVCRPRFDELVVVQPRVRSLQDSGCDVVLVCVGDQPYRPTELADVTDAQLFAVLRDDARAATAAAHGQFSDRHVRRSAWWQAVRDIAADLAAGMYVPSPGFRASELTASEVRARR